MLGYSDCFVGALMIGYALDFAGGMSRLVWGVLFGLVAVLMLLAFRMMRTWEQGGRISGGTETAETAGNGVRLA